MFFKYDLKTCTPDVRSPTDDDDTIPTDSTPSGDGVSTDSTDEVPVSKSFPLGEQISHAILSAAISRVRSPSGYSLNYLVGFFVMGLTIGGLSTLSFLKSKNSSYEQLPAMEQQPTYQSTL
jgi:hypothetical protein